jgi:hypothetical protein
MKPILHVLLAASLVTAPLPAAAGGPIERAIAVHAARLAAEPVAPSGSEQTGVELRWAELGPVIAGQRVTAVLSDGSRITGDAVVVRDDALVLDVKRATGSQAYAGSNAPVPRPVIRTLEIERHGGAGRTLGTVLGVLAGVVIGGWVSAEVADSAGVGIPLFLGIASGITVAGYYAGKQVSKRVTLIRIID